jgi:hypothetical protein
MLALEMPKQFLLSVLNDSKNPPPASLRSAVLKDEFVEVKMGMHINSY